MSGHALIGRTVAGRFRVTGYIGDGAMATVYRGMQDAEPRDVAIKVMHPHLESDPTFVGRFRREAKAASRLKHPNTVQILDFGADDGLLYIAMELLAGQDLFELLVLERRLSQSRTARIMMQVCDALAMAHDAGIVHRDLKPENVMVLRDDAGGERVKVLDFGIAKILDRDPDEAPNSMTSSVLTTVGVVVGTPAYMSPEQCRGEPIDARSDVYSAGIMIYQLLTGALPFNAAGAFDTAVMHVQSPPPRAGELVAGLHPGLEAVIQKALAKWPAQRQQSARALHEELGRLLPELPATVDRVAPGSNKPSTPRQRVTPIPVSGRGGVASGPGPIVSPRRLPSIDDDDLVTKNSPAHKAPVPPPVDPGPTSLRTQPSAPAVAVAPPAPEIEVTEVPMSAPFGAPPSSDGVLPAVSGAAMPQSPITAPGPASATIVARRAAAAASGWVLLPVAVLVGVGIGVLAFFLSR